MVLTFDQIVGLIKSEHIINSNTWRVQGASLDIVASNIACIESNCNNTFDFSPLNPYYSEEIVIPEEGFVLKPKQTVTVVSEESFKLPENLVAIYCSVATLSLVNIGPVGNGFVNRNYEGQFKVPLHNFNSHQSVVIKPKTIIGQLIFISK